MKASVFRETYPNERRVALVPLSVPQLAKAGIEVLVEQGAGLAAGIPDQRYREKGATVVADRSVLFEAELIVKVHSPGVGWEGGRADLAQLRAGSYVIGMCD
ncbi:MAG: NAD(P)(+) transhydrogenase (Re/Si-specific) subunit alpha, partial [Planctomycetes bacterium]|nr:NAD(P)(+) transhydrogenase (Re/Si-specific) subunit alpha [Planctomycetota bacterium]